MDARTEHAAVAFGLAYHSQPLDRLCAVHLVGTIVSLVALHPARAVQPRGVQVSRSRACLEREIENPAKYGSCSFDRATLAVSWVFQAVHPNYIKARNARAYPWGNI